MKKLLTMVLVLLLLFALVGCSEQAESPTATMDIPLEQVDTTPVNEEFGILAGEVFYNDIPVSRLFIESFMDVLGDPLDEHGTFFSYEGLEIIGSLGDLMGYDNVAIQLNALKPDMLTLNGVSLAMTRAEIIAIFGAPYYDIVEHDHSLTYHVSSPTVEYVVRFWFEYPEDDMPVFSISVFRLAEQE